MSDLLTLNVHLHGKPVGSLSLLGGDRVLFAFNQAYIDDEERDTFSLSFKDQFGGLITDIRPTQTSAPPFFANLLPEGPLRDYLSRRAGVKTKRDFFLLWALGQDLPGAITLHAQNGETYPPLGGENEDDADRSSSKQQPLRFSLAGVQLKFSAISAAASGLTIPVNGVGGSWIAKLPSTTYEMVPENEFAMMTLARLVGIDVPEIRLLPVEDIHGLPEGMGRAGAHAFAIRRFDRLDDGTAVHIEDFAQVFGVYPDKKYEKASYRSIAKVLRAEGDECQIQEFIRRLAFNTLIGNGDMHLKNWSLIYPDRRTPVLSPAYDFVSTIAYLEDTGMALKFARTKSFAKATMDEFVYLAAKAQLPRKLVVDTVIDTTSRFQGIWNREKGHLGLPDRFIQKIDLHLGALPLARGL
ncbi:MAG: HipA domain-containing protein [Rhodospirillales bacterium]|jgi:serine/threonine-protein kinase HipA|nr:HipA domain-containing protein [Rhodospirillales bacterium]